MAASEHTPHYNLSQFGPDDRPSWLDDYNADMRIIDTALGDGNQAVTDMTTEITAIKNKLDTSNTVFNYFTWSGSKHRYVTPGESEAFVIGDTSKGGLGNNDIINLANESAVQVNKDGIYAIWGTINVGRFSGGLNAPVALSLMYMSSGESGPGYGIIHGNFITALTTPEPGSPTLQLEQSLSLPPTVVSLRSGAIAALSLFIYNDTNEPPESGNTPIEVRQFGAATGIVKIR